MFHYNAGGQRWYRNVDALATFTKDPTQPLEFALDFAFFNKPELWLTEPPESLATYQQRYAAILRDRYRNIYIEYSGGTDSHTAFTAFQNVNCPVHLTHITSEKISNQAWVNFLRLKPDLQKISRMDLVKSFRHAPWAAPTAREFRRMLDNARGNMHAAVYASSYQHNTSLDQTSALNWQNTDCIVIGKEKPFVRVIDGWWCWQTNDAQFADGYMHIDQGDIIWFFISDDVPEIQIKITWQKIAMLEKIARIEGVEITDSWAMATQSTDSKWYETLNIAQGYNALQPILNTNYYKVDGESNIRRRQYNDWYDKSGITDVQKEWFEDDVKPYLRDDLLDHVNNKPVGVWTKPIKVRPVAK